MASEAVELGKKPPKPSLQEVLKSQASANGGEGTATTAKQGTLATRVPVMLDAVSYPEMGVAASFPAVATVNSAVHLETIAARNECLGRFVAALAQARTSRAQRQQVWREREKLQADNWSRSVAKIRGMHAPSD